MEGLTNKVCSFGDFDEIRILLYTFVQVDYVRFCFLVILPLFSILKALLSLLLTGSLGVHTLKVI